MDFYYLTPSQILDRTGCMKPCHYIDYPVKQTQFDMLLPKGRTHSIEVSLMLEDRFVEFHEEYLQFDGLSLLGELGGFFGLFLGLSFYHVFERIISSCVKGKKKVKK